MGCSNPVKIISMLVIHEIARQYGQSVAALCSLDLGSITTSELENVPVRCSRGWISGHFLRLPACIFSSSDICSCQADPSYLPRHVTPYLSMPKLSIIRLSTGSLMTCGVYGWAHVPHACYRRRPSERYRDLQKHARCLVLRSASWLPKISLSAMNPDREALLCRSFLATWLFFLVSARLASSSLR